MGNETINSLNDNLNNLPILKKQLKQYNLKLNKILKTKNIDLSEEELEEKLILIENINGMEKQIKLLESGQKKEEYLLNTSHMLFHYFDENDAYTNVSESP